MTGFLIVAGLLLAAGVGALLWPLLRGGSTDGEAKRQAADIVALFRDQLRELDAERAAGNVGDLQYEQSRRDIERRLLDEVAIAQVPQPALQRARWSATIVAVLLLAGPIGLYVALGTPVALVPGMEASGDSQAGGAAARPLSSAQVQKMIEGLAENLKKSPGDVEGWTMLARAYSYERQYADAVRAYTRAVALKPQDARLLADLADTMAMANGRKLDGEPLRIIDRALQIDPKEVKALALAGTGAFEHQEYAKAAQYWERAIAANPPDPELVKGLRASVDEAHRLAAGSGKAGPLLPDTAAGAPFAAPAGAASDTAGTATVPSSASPAAAAGGSGGTGAKGGTISGKVNLATGLAAKASPGDTVFVFARAAQGPRVPLALLRRQVKDLPFEFSLDDSMAMVPDFTLSKYSPVIVGARISHSGDAIAAAGDLQGFSKPVTTGAAAVNVTIDQVVP